MTAAQLNIFVSLSVLEPLPEGDERCRVPYEWSINGFGLSLASCGLMLEASSLGTGCNTPLAPTEVPSKEGVSQWEELDKDNKSTGDSDTVLVEDAPP